MIDAETGLLVVGVAALIATLTLTLVVLLVTGTEPSGRWRAGSWLRQSFYDHWWRVLLVGSGAVAAWAAAGMAWKWEAVVPWQEQRGLNWPWFLASLAVLLVFPVVWKLVNYWSSPGRVLSLLTFMSFAGLASYLAWRIIDSAAPGTTTTDGPMTVIVEATTIDRATVIALVAAAVVALVIAVGGPDLIRRVTKVGSGGIELGVWQDVARIPDVPTPALPKPPYFGDSYFNSDCDWPDPEPLSTEEEWLYQRGTTLVLHFDREGVTADDLTGRDLRRYTRIVHWVGSIALSQREIYKALELLTLIEHVQGLELEELYTIARAYYDVANEELSAATSPQQKREYEDRLLRAERLLRLALKRDPDHAPSHWYLGYIYDELGQYGRAIEHNKRAILNDRASFLNIGSWNLAVSLLKNEQPLEALEALREITGNACWSEIIADEELERLRRYPEFFKLWRRST